MRHLIALLYLCATLPLGAVLTEAEYRLCKDFKDQAIACHACWTELGQHWIQAIEATYIVSRSNGAILQAEENELSTRGLTIQKLTLNRPALATCHEQGTLALQKYAELENAHKTFLAALQTHHKNGEALEIIEANSTLGNKFHEEGIESAIFLAQGIPLLQTVFDDLEKHDDISIFLEEFTRHIGRTKNRASFFKQVYPPEY